MMGWETWKFYQHFTYLYFLQLPYEINTVLSQFIDEETEVQKKSK